MPKINSRQLKNFANHGYVVLPQIVPPELVASARSAADELRQRPPRTGHRGPQFYFLFPELPNRLIAPLYDSAAIKIAESIITPGAILQPPDHVQISLNIPPWDHRPGGPHIDGLTPPGPDGQPGTFTMLVGIFLTDQIRKNAGNLWEWPGSHRSPGNSVTWSESTVISPLVR